MKHNIALLLFLVLLPSIFASNLYIGSTDSGLVVQPFTYNAYYKDVLYVGGEPYSGTSPFILQKNGASVSPQQQGTKFAIYEGITYTSSYTIVYQDQKYSLSFCNNNNLCEPCFDEYCELMENALTCADCMSGSSDMYCDLAQDGVCDSDCEYYDFDCDDCIDNTCVTEEEERTACVDIGGRFCNKQCDGFFTYSDDAGMQCCIGSCVEISDTTTSMPSRSSQQQEQESFDWAIFLMIGAIIVVLLVSVVFIVIFESKAIHKEHEVRSYVQKLRTMGYSQQQIKDALVKQRIDAHIILRILK
jgi:hypothetical protein